MPHSIDRAPDRSLDIMSRRERRLGFQLARPRDVLVEGERTARIFLVTDLLLKRSHLRFAVDAAGSGGLLSNGAVSLDQ